MTAVGPKTGGWWLWRKQAIAAVVTALLPSPRQHALQLHAPLRVAYLRFDRRVGEVLLQTAIFAAHKAARPADTVVAVTHPKMVRVLAGQPHVDVVVPFSWRGFPVTSQSRQLLAGLRALAVDVVVDCSDPTVFSVGHALAARQVAAPVRLAFDRGLAHKHNTQVVPVPTPLHEATARVALLAPLGVQAAPDLFYAPKPCAPVLHNGEDVGALMKAQRGAHVLVCPGGRLGWRRAGVHHFAAVCHAVLQAGRTPWLAPGPGEEELCREVAAACPAARLLDVTDLDQLAMLMQAAGATVCNNSGTMHLAAASASRTFALFVHMDPTRWGHHQRSHVMYRLEPEDPHGAQQLAHAVGAWLAEAP